MKRATLRSSFAYANLHAKEDPSNMIFGQPVDAASEFQAQLLYVAALTLLGILLVANHAHTGVQSCTCILLYVYSLSFMSIMIRNVYVNHGFHYPEWVTASHFLATSVVGLLILTYRRLIHGQHMRIPSLWTLCTGIVPVSLAFSLSIGFANIGLLYANAHFYEMVGSCTPLVTALLNIALGRDVNKVLCLPLLLITVGMMLVAVAEVQFKMLGWTFIMLGVVGRASKATLQSMVMSAESGMTKLDPVELAVWTSSICFFIMAWWSWARDGLEPFHRIRDVPTSGAVLLTMGNACVINLSALFVIKNLGPVTQQMVGQLKAMLSCIGAVALCGEVITRREVMGYMVLVIGVVWYTQADRILKEKEKRALKGLRNPFGAPWRSCDASQVQREG